MIHWRTWVGVVLMAFGVAVAAPVQVRADQVLNFEDLTPATSWPASMTGLPVPNNYGGFGWTNFNYLDVAAFDGASSGYENLFKKHGSNIVAINLGGDSASLAISAPDPFTFKSVQLASAWYNDMTVTMVGSLGGIQQFTTSAIVNMNDWINFSNNIAFSNLAIDKLTFSTSGGTGSTGRIFIMDNLVLGSVQTDPSPGAVPEPSSVISAAVAVVAGLGYGVRRRRAV
jgi:hypothetical protein